MLLGNWAVMLLATLKEVPGCYPDDGFTLIISSHAPIVDTRLLELRLTNNVLIRPVGPYGGEKPYY